MNKIEKKIQLTENKILESKVEEQANQLITEMKKIGIEKLPYSYSALKQFIDAETMNFHYNKHYKGYVDKLNNALSKKEYGDVELEQIIKTISRFDKSIRNNAGGAFNHALFWNMLTPTPKKLEGDLYKKIIKDFGSFPAFKKKFEAVAKDRFGSGWVWLVLTTRNTLKIMSTPNQDNPLMNVIEGGGFPLLGLDLWEHAYYLKYRNKRDEYIANFWKVVNWDFVTKMYEMKTKTKLAESMGLKKLMSEAKSEACSPEETDFYRKLFNTHKDIESRYRAGIERILIEVFSDLYVSNPPKGELPGIFNLENEGRSVINKLNTNYTTFCILLSDINQVIKTIEGKKPIVFKGKKPNEQLKEVERFVNALDHFKYRIFDTKSSTFVNIMKTLEDKNAMGDKREEITAAILRRFFGKDVKIEQVGKLGSKEDALSGIDLKLTSGDKTETAQVKPFKVKIVDEEKGTIILLGTGKVKYYSTDLLIFQKGKNVLVFNQKPKIIGGNYVFPIDALKLNIE
jgi:Fe-Mn family superoxide dismutase